MATHIRRQWAVTIRPARPDAIAGRPLSWHWTYAGAWRRVAWYLRRPGVVRAVARATLSTLNVEHRRDVKVVR